MTGFHSLLLQASFSHEVSGMLKRLSHAFARPGNAVLYARSVGQHWVVRRAELALAGGCPPSGAHGQPIVDVDV